MVENLPVLAGNAGGFNPWFGIAQSESGRFPKLLGGDFEALGMSCLMGASLVCLEALSHTNNVI